MWRARNASSTALGWTIALGTFLGQFLFFLTFCPVCDTVSDLLQWALLLALAINDHLDNVADPVPEAQFTQIKDVFIVSVLCEHK